MGTSKKILQIPDTLLLSHNIPWPVVAERPPISHQHLLSQRADTWQRQAMALYLVSQGFSLVVEIRALMAIKLGVQPSAGSLKRVIAALLQAKFLTGRILPLRASKTIPMQVVRLTARGRALCSHVHRQTDDASWLPHETSWERMRRVHEGGKREPAHTLAVQVFSYQARVRGWQAGVMPKINTGRFVPDAIIQRGAEQIYVEVELGYGKEAKWLNMAAQQGLIALCARTPAHQEALVIACDLVDVPILATNLSSLFLNHAPALWASA